MSYVGNKPAQTTIPADDAVTTAMLKDDAVTSAKIAGTTIVNADINASAGIANSKMASDTTSASNISTGTLGSARMGTGSASSSTVLYGDGTWKAEPVTDTTPLLNDIATLALHSAVQNNQTAFNLTNAFVDQYEDDTGIDVETTCGRNATGEYMSSIVIDTDTILYLDMDGSDGGTTFTDTSVSAHTIGVLGDTHTDTTVKKWGTASAQFDGTTDGLYVVGSNVATAGYPYFNFGTDDYTIEAWNRSDSSGNNEEYIWAKQGGGAGANTDPYYFQFTRSNMSTGWTISMPSGSADKTIYSSASTWAADTWYHVAVAREGATSSYWFDGTRVGTVTSSDAISTAVANCYFAIGCSYAQAGASHGYVHQGYIDDLRVSKVARYSGASITVPTGPLGAGTINAAGNYTSTTETATDTVSKMGIVVLYKNAYGTATLDTDLIAQVSANGGTNYTSAPLTAAGTFSTGINIAVANDITISNTGTTTKYKISFANQAESSKETQVHGVALLY